LVPETRLLTVDPAEAGMRLDAFAAQVCSELTRAAVQRLIASDAIRLNQKHVSKSGRVKVGDLVEIHWPAPEPAALQPENIPLDILYEDDELIVVNKPRGMVVHPAPGHYSGTAVHALLYHCQGRLAGLNGVLRPGVVHRIDKDTSGALVFAKTDRAFLSLSAQLSAHSMERRYHAIAVGSLQEDSLIIDKPIGRHPVERTKMAVTDKNSRSAVTHIQVLERFDGLTYVEARLETGRTHQIRVHMSYIGRPLLGDGLYGAPAAAKVAALAARRLPDLNGQALHAKVLGFEHPVTGRQITLETELPAYFQNCLAILRDGKEAENGKK
jgi:23S rRNA pseudouridine1911/1915/1917 synthase